MGGPHYLSRARVTMQFAYFLQGAYCTEIDHLSVNWNSLRTTKERNISNFECMQLDTNIYKIFLVIMLFAYLD